MSELFPKVKTVRVPEEVVRANGGDRQLIEAMKRRLDERLLEQMKEIGWRNQVKR